MSARVFRHVEGRHRQLKPIRVFGARRNVKKKLLHGASINFVKESDFMSFVTVQT